jgi:hypothetical protein
MHVAFLPRAPVSEAGRKLENSAPVLAFDAAFIPFPCPFPSRATPPGPTGSVIFQAPRRVASLKAGARAEGMLTPI